MSPAGFIFFFGLSLNINKRLKTVNTSYFRVLFILYFHTLLITRCLLRKVRFSEETLGDWGGVEMETVI